MRGARLSLIEIVPFALVVLLLAAGSYWRNRLWNDETALWTDCAKKSPGKARVYVNLGVAFFNEKIYDKAQEVTEKAVQIDPALASGYFSLCNILEKRGDLDKAIAMCRRSLEIDPGLYKAYYSLGRLYFQKGQYEESSQALKKFTGFFPYFPEVHHFLAVVYAAQKQFDKAVAEFEMEVRVNPNHSLAHLNLGLIYWHEFRNRRRPLITSGRH